MGHKISELRLRVPMGRAVKPVGRISGFDTETLKTGYAFLLADEYGDHVWVRSVDDVIPFVTSGMKYVCYNMDFDASAVLKWFGEAFCKELLERGRATFRGIIHVQYVPRKYLYFRVGNKWTMFWDVSQYYSVQGRHTTLAKAAKWVRMQKMSFLVDDMDESYYGNQQLLEYCVNDARVTGALGRLVVRDLARAGIVVTGLASPATIVESFIVDQCGVRIPNMVDIPDEALQFAENAVMPPWREFFKRGYFRWMYDYDISSAYPAVIRNLPNLKYGTWIYRKSTVPAGAKLGYIQCVVDIPDVYVYWVNYRNSFGDNFTPTGKFPVTLTLNGLRRQLRPPKIIDGWYWVSDVERPLFSKVVDDLYALKSATSRRSFRRHLLKVLLASIYGKFHQVMDEGVTGRLYNPFYTAEVMTDTRLKVYDLACQRPEALIGIHTDCVYSTEGLDVALGEYLGSWEMRGTSSMLAIGLNHFEKGNGFLYYALSKEPEKVEYVARYGKGLRPMSMAEAVRGNFEDANVFLPFEEKVDVVRQVYKRRWLSLPKCGGNLLSNVYDSRPFPVGIAEALNAGDVLWEV